MDDVPKRIQRRRVKGWRMPPNTIYAGRPSKLGNPFPSDGSIASARRAKAAFRRLFEHPPSLARHNILRILRGNRGRGEAALAHITESLEHLRGKNIACWCALCARHRDGKPLGEECADCAPCHVDVLLELANR